MSRGDKGAAEAVRLMTMGESERRGTRPVTDDYGPHRRLRSIDWDLVIDSGRICSVCELPIEEGQLVISHLDSEIHGACKVLASKPFDLTSIGRRS